MSTNHDLSFSKSTDNSSTRISIGASNTEGTKQNRFRQIYICFEQMTFGGALKVDTKVIYSLRDEAALVTNNVGFIGNLIGAAMYWNPTDRLNNDGSFNVRPNGSQVIVILFLILQSYLKLY
jgi:iron complex outermembrane receptor protein